MKFILLLIDVHLLHSSFDILVAFIQTEVTVSLYKLVIRYRKFYLFEGNSIGIKEMKLTIIVCLNS